MAGQNAANISLCIHSTRTTTIHYCILSQTMELSFFVLLFTKPQLMVMVKLKVFLNSAHLPWTSDRRRSLLPRRWC